MLPEEALGLGEYCDLLDSEQLTVSVKSPQATLLTPLRHRQGTNHEAEEDKEAEAMYHLVQYPS